MPKTSRRRTVLIAAVCVVVAVAVAMFWAHEEGKKGKYGVISPDGSWVISPKFKDLSAGVNPDCIAARDDETGMWGIINLKGEWVLSPAFAEVKPYETEGLFCAKDSESQLWGFVDHSGSWVTDPSFLYSASFENGVAEVLLDAGNDKVCTGYVDTTGAWVIPPNFWYIEKYPSEGTAEAQEKDTGLYGTIDNRGNWVEGPVEASDWARGSKSADATWEEWYPTYVEGEGDNRRYGYMDGKGGRATEAIYLEAKGSPDPNHLPVSTEEGVWRYVNLEGQTTLEGTSEDPFVGASTPDEFGRACVERLCPSERTGSSATYLMLIDVATGGQAHALTLEGGVSTYSMDDWGGESRYIDKDTGNMLKYDPVSKLWGVADLYGSWIVEPEFFDVRGFDDEGCCIVGTRMPDDETYVRRSYGCINAQGEWVIPSGFYDIGYFMPNGLAVAEEYEVGESNREGIINRQGEWVVEPKYDHINVVSGTEFAEVRVYHDDQSWYGLIDMQGNEIVAPLYSSLEVLKEDGTSIVRVLED